MDTVSSRIAQRLKELNLKPTNLAADIGASRGTVSMWLSGSTNPTGERLIKTARFLQTTPEWVLTGNEPQEKFKAASPLVVTKEDYQHSFIWIDVVNIHFSCGDGISIEYHYEEIMDSLPFMPDFFTKRGVKPENTKIMVASGDSMEDYIYDHDLFAVDLATTEVKDGDIYAVYFEGEAMLKQIFKEEGGVLVLHSKNPKYPDKRVTEKNGHGFKVIGRQFWRSG